MTEERIYELKKDQEKLSNLKNKEGKKTEEQSPEPQQPVDQYQKIKT